MVRSILGFINPIRIFLLGLAILIIVFITICTTRGISESIIEGATDSCLKFIEPAMPFHTILLQSKGDNNQASFRIKVQDPSQTLVCTIDWFNYMSHGEYIIVWVKPEQSGG